MKKIHILFVLTVFYLSIFSFSNVNAQRFGAQDCGQAMSSMTFQSRKQQISQVREFQRLQMAKQLLQETCLLSSQVKEIVEILIDDVARLDFAKTAYTRTVDRQNFYEVYNGFTYFSTVFMLHDFVAYTRGAYNPNDNPVNPINPNPVNPVRTVTFPNYFYPNSANYQGTIKCNTPINDNIFMQMAQEVFNFGDENARIGKINEYLQSNCFTTAQLMRFGSLITSENNRLSFLKIAYIKVFDANNYNQASQLFTNQMNQQSFFTFIQQDGGFVPNNPTNPTNPITTNCTVPDADFNDMRTRISRETFSNTRLSLAKTIIGTRTCFSVTQIRTLSALMSQDEQRLDIAKFAYDYCNPSQRMNYFQISDIFTFSRTKESFMAFLQTKR